MESLRLHTYTYTNVYNTIITSPEKRYTTQYEKLRFFLWYSLVLLRLLAAIGYSDERTEKNSDNLYWQWITPLTVHTLSESLWMCFHSQRETWRKLHQWKNDKNDKKDKKQMKLNIQSTRYKKWQKKNVDYNETSVAFCSSLSI